MKGTILVVEGDDGYRTGLELAFKRAEITHPIQEVNDGQKAMEYLQGVGKYGDRTQFPIPCLVVWIGNCRECQAWSY